MYLITGASGFIGRRLAADLAGRGASVRCMTQQPEAGACVADLSDLPALRLACTGIERVFHCAGYAHAFSASSADEAKRHWQVNCEGTRNLLEAAGEAGVRKFIFLSSVKAMAEPGDACADEDFPGEPQTAYGQAKRAAEQAVLEAGRRYDMQVVNLRLAMVYGRGGRGNLERMGRMVARGLFPPLPETGNRRSLVHVGDVVAAMRRVADDARADDRTYIVASSESPSGRGLYDAMRMALKLPPCNWAVPAKALRAAARIGDGIGRLAGKRMPLDSEALDRLVGSAWYSSARIERELGWRAEIGLAEGLAEMFGNEKTV